ncbi:hypothetical protein [Clostridium cuniculi]|nr:hypothetical protein [Clostridium cuniculi]
MSYLECMEMDILDYIEYLEFDIVRNPIESSQADNSTNEFIEREY